VIGPDTRNRRSEKATVIYALANRLAAFFVKDFKSDDSVGEVVKRQTRTLKNLILLLSSILIPFLLELLLLNSNNEKHATW
jgi:hypothetical protein